MRKLVMLGVFFALFPLAAISHDFYMSYVKDDALELDRPFYSSQIGWLWETYAPGLYESAKDSVDPDNWKQWVLPVLKQGAFAVTIWPPVVLFALALLWKLWDLGVMATQRMRHSGDGPAIPKAEKQKKFKAPSGKVKYKRK